MKTISTVKAPNSPELLSQGLVVDGIIYTAGFIHMNRDGVLIEGNIEHMFKQIIDNIKSVLVEADSSLENVIKVTLYLTDMKLLPIINEVYKTSFKQPMPVREAIGVKELPLGAKIEMSVVARTNNLISN